MKGSPSSHTYISQRLRLHYVEWGNENAPPLLLLHGGYDHCRSWDWIAQELAKDWHVICPDLRGHGDSQWSPDGDYSRSAFVYDLAQLIHQKKLAPLKIVCHSMGGIIALSYAGVFPETVSGIVNIEGLGFSEKFQKERDARSIDESLRTWIEQKRAVAARQPRRYATLNDALERMKEENSYLSDEQALHLTQHASSQNEDGTFSWKFDNYLHALPADSGSQEEISLLFSKIDCPVSIFWGTESFLPIPNEQSWTLKALKNHSLTIYEKAGHWLHHDQTTRFIGDIKKCLSADNNK